MKKYKPETPEWFTLLEIATPQTMQRIANSVQALNLPLQVKHLPMQAHWFLLDSLLIANQANRQGMHANAMAITRQCLEAISIVELGLCEKKVPWKHSTGGTGTNLPPASFGSGLRRMYGGTTGLGSGLNHGANSWAKWPTQSNPTRTIPPN